MLAGTLDSDGELVIHSFSDEGHQLSELTGSVTDLSSTVRLMGKNSQGNTRIWRIRVARHDAVHAVMLEHEQHLDVAEREEHAFTVSADALRAKIAAFAAGGADVAAASATTVTTEAAAREGSAWEEAVNKATAALPAEADEVTLETLELDAGVGAEWSVDAAAATASGADPTAVSAAEVDAQAQLERARAVREKELGLAIAALSKMERSVVTERRATHVEALAARRAAANVNKTAALAAVEAELAQVVAESSTKTAAAEARPRCAKSAPTPPVSMSLRALQSLRTALRLLSLTVARTFRSHGEFVNSTEARPTRSLSQRISQFPTLIISIPWTPRHSSSNRGCRSTRASSVHWDVWFRLRRERSISWSGKRRNTRWCLALVSR